MMLKNGSMFAYIQGNLFNRIVIKFIKNQDVVKVSETIHDVRSGTCFLDLCLTA